MSTLFLFNSQYLPIVTLLLNIILGNLELFLLISRFSHLEGLF